MSTQFDKKEMDEIENILSDFLQRRSIELTPPVDIFAFATQLGFDVHAAEMPGTLEGMLMVDEFQDKVGQFNSNKVILYDIFPSMNDIKFIVGHELAHYIEKKNPHHTGCEEEQIVAAARDHTHGYSTNKSEQRKDYMAAAILIPKKDLIDRYGARYSNIQGNHEELENLFKEMAEFYGVRELLAQRRVKEVFDGK